MLVRRFGPVRRLDGHTAVHRLPAPSRVFEHFEA